MPVLTPLGEILAAFTCFFIGLVVGKVWEGKIKVNKETCTIVHLNIDNKLRKIEELLDKILVEKK